MARTRTDDVFPFLVPHAPPGSLNASFEDVMRWYWRVETWKLEFSLGTISTVLPSPYSSATFSLITGTSIYTRFDPADELDETSLVVPARGAGYYSATGGQDVLSIDSVSVSPSHPYTLHDHYMVSNFGLFGRGSSGTQPGITYDPDTNTYSPVLVGSVYGTIAIAFDYGGGGAPQLYYFQYFSYEVSGPPTPQVVSGTVVIDGYSFGRDYYFKGTPLDLSACEPVLTITPVAYWPYIGTDGVALFDTATGQPATNPATGQPFTTAEIIAAPFP